MTYLVEELVVLLRLIEKERLDSELGVPVRWLAHTYAALGDEEMFVKWAKKAMESVPLLLPVIDPSESSAATQEQDVGKVGDAWKIWLDDPTSHPLWSLREEQKGF